MPGCEKSNPVVSWSSLPPIATSTVCPAWAPWGKIVCRSGCGSWAVASGTPPRKRVVKMSRLLIFGPVMPDGPSVVKEKFLGIKKSPDEIFIGSPPASGGVRFSGLLGVEDQAGFTFGNYCTPVVTPRSGCARKRPTMQFAMIRASTLASPFLTRRAALASSSEFVRMFVELTRCRACAGLYHLRSHSQALFMSGRPNTENDSLVN